MSSYCRGIGLFGTGSNPAVVSELVALGAMEAFLVKGAQCTLWRFRYSRITNFAMDAVGQPFGITPAFGGHSQIILNKVGDLLYYMYVVIDLPGIYACRRSSKTAAYEDYDYDEDDAGGGEREYDYAPASQFPSYSGRPAQNYHHEIGAEYGEMTKQAWLRQNYGGYYNPEEEPSSVPQDEKPWCHWSNAIGQLMMRRAVLVVGGHQSDTLYSDYIFMWEELCGKAGKRLREMIGKRKSRKQLIKDARHDQRFYVPLPWYFCLTSGNALPMCTLKRHGVQVHIEWERLGKCVVVSHDDVEVRKCADKTKLTNQDLKAWLDTTYIYLDIEERNRFSLANFDQLMTQVQFISAPALTDEVTVPLTFNHPCIELIWAVRRKCNEAKNNHFNYSGFDGRDPIEEVNLRLNNVYRFAGREGRYYRLVQPYQFHSSIPKAHIYCYCFGLFPEEPQPSGSLNMSRIDNVDMTFCLQEGLAKEGCTVLIYCRGWNIMRFTEGLGGPLFNA